MQSEYKGVDVKIDTHRWYSKVILTGGNTEDGREVLYFDASIQAGDAITVLDEEEWVKEKLRLYYEGEEVPGVVEVIPGVEEADSDD